MKSINVMAGCVVCAAALSAGCSSSGSASGGSGGRAGGATGSTAAAHQASDGGKITCAQLTAADVQPLMTGKVNGTKVSAVGVGGKGQQCVFSAVGDQAVDVIVAPADDQAFGYEAAKKHADKPVPLPGIGDEAYREAGAGDPYAKHGNVFCTVSTASTVQFPGASTKLILNGSNHVTEAQNTVLATALGTLCNRLFGTGNTTVDLSGL